LRKNWFTKPETFGDIALINLLGVIVRKLNIIELEERTKSMPGIATGFYKLVKETHLIKRLLAFLESNSNTKKDVSLLILLHLTCSRLLLEFLIEEGVLKAILQYLESLKELSILFLKQVIKV
jgi:hypothetical protein